MLISLLDINLLCFCFRSLGLTRSLAEEKKEEGNAYYKNKEYHKALVCYSRAIG